MNLRGLADAILNSVFLISTLSVQTAEDDRNLRKAIEELREIADYLVGVTQPRAFKEVPYPPTLTDRLKTGLMAQASLFASFRHSEDSEPSKLVIPLCSPDFRNHMSALYSKWLSLTDVRPRDPFKKSCAVCSEIIQHACPDYGPIRVVGHTTADHLSSAPHVWTENCDAIINELQSSDFSAKLDLKPLRREEE